MASPVAIADHIILLIPHTTLLHLPDWLTDAFTIIPGGRHADGLTENSLVLFRDGVYLEFIAFIPPATTTPTGGQDGGRASHHWGARKDGTIVDWSVTTSSEEELNIVRQRVAEKNEGAVRGGTGYRLRYSDPVPGGRTKPDGTEIRWVLSRAVVSSSSSDGGGGDDDDDDGGKGEAPFWCLDKTTREVRVPYSGNEATRHPSGALGIAKVVIEVRGGDAGKGEDVWKGLKEVYDGLYGVDGVEIVDEENRGGGVKAYQWPLTVPDEKNVGAGKPLDRTVVLRFLPGVEGGGHRQASVGIRLTLFSDATDGVIGGELGAEDGEKVEFELVKV